MSDERTCVKLKINEKKLKKRLDILKALQCSELSYVKIDETGIPLVEELQFNNKIKDNWKSINDKITSFPLMM